MLHLLVFGVINISRYNIINVNNVIVTIITIIIIIKITVFSCPAIILFARMKSSKRATSPRLPTNHVP